MTPIVFDAEQTAGTLCPPAGSCGPGAAVQLQRKGPGEVHDEEEEEEEEKNSTPGLPRVLIHQAWQACRFRRQLCSVM